MAEIKTVGELVNQLKKLNQNAIVVMSIADDIKDEKSSVEFYKISYCSGDNEVVFINDGGVEFKKKTSEIDEELHKMFELIDNEHLDAARQKIKDLEIKLGHNNENLLFAASLINFLEIKE
ncbi:MAG: hypothetical protein ACOC56_02715 [Atribacterota bacterium]